MEIDFEKIKVEPTENLIKYLQDNDYYKSLIAVVALGDRKEKGVKSALKVALKEERFKNIDDEPNIRKNIVASIGRIGDESDIPELESVIFNDDEDGDVKCAAISALDDIHDVRGIPLLMSALNNRGFRYHATIALRNFGDQAIPFLVQGLKNDDSRDWIIERIIPEIDDGVNKLLMYYNEGDEDTQSHLAIALGMLGENAVIPSLINNFGNESEEMVCDSIRAIGDIGEDKGVFSLINSLKDKREAVHECAVDAIISNGTEEMIPALLNLLKDNDDHGRINAIKILGRIGKTEALPEIIAAINDSNEDIQYYAIEALGRIGSEKAESVLNNLLVSEDDDTRCNAAAALLELGSENLTKNIINALWDTDEDVRSHIAELLEKVGTEEIIPAVEKLFDDKREMVRYLAVQILSNIGHEDALNGIVKAIDDQDDDVRIIAIESLHHFSNKTTIPILLPLLSHNDEETVDAAMNELLEIGEDAKPTLMQMLEDETPESKILSIGILGRIGGPELTPFFKEAIKIETNSDVIDQYNREISRLRLIEINNYDDDEDDPVDESNAFCVPDIDEWGMLSGYSAPSGFDLYSWYSSEEELMEAMEKVGGRLRIGWHGPFRDLSLGEDGESLREDYRGYPNGSPLLERDWEDFAEFLYKKNCRAAGIDDEL